MRAHELGTDEVVQEFDGFRAFEVLRHVAPRVAIDEGEPWPILQLDGAHHYVLQRRVAAAIHRERELHERAVPESLVQALKPFVFGGIL